MHAGVGRSGETPVVVRERGIAVEPEADTLQREVDECEHGSLNACRLRDAHIPARERNAPVEVARGNTENQADQHHRRSKAEHALPEGQREHEERDVDPELGVRLAGRRGIYPQQHLLPARGRGKATEQTKHRGQAPLDQAAQRLNQLLIAIELRSESRIHRSFAVGDVDREKHRNRHREEPDEKHRSRGDPLCQQHLHIPQLIEPEHLGDHRGSPEKAENEQHDEHDSHRKGRKSAAASLWSSVGRVSHVETLLS